MAELDMVMYEGSFSKNELVVYRQSRPGGGGEETQLTIISRKLLQADNDVFLWCTRPRALRDEVRSHGLILLVPEHAAGALLDIDDVSGIDEGLGGGRSHCESARESHE